MAWALNQIVVAGRLTRDPELQFGASGTAYCRFAIAQNDSTKNPDGSFTDGPASFFEVTVFYAQAENVANSLRKGDGVVVFGRILQEHWEKDGQKRSAHRITADIVAPDLRWAEASITRNQRNGGGGAPTPPPERFNAPQGDNYGYDEEPF